MLSLFDFELKQNDEPEDDTRITLVNLYFSSSEKARFNELCKAGMLEYYGQEARKANAVDFMLDLLEKSFGAKRPPVQQLRLGLDQQAVVASLERLKDEINKIETLVANGNQQGIQLDDSRVAVGERERQTQA